MGFNGTYPLVTTYCGRSSDEQGWVIMITQDIYGQMVKRSRSFRDDYV